jgi:hypothetical protein
MEDLLMKPMNINGMEITFDERPKHKSVVAARGIMTGEMLKLIDIKNIDPTKDVSAFMADKLEKDPDIVTKLADLKAEIELDQTIILATGLDYSTLVELKEEMYADDFVALYEKSTKALGGKTAEDFFSIYPTSTNLMGKKVAGL